MQDRYLFQGERIDSYNKEWVTGHYLSVPRPMIVLDELQLNGSWYWFEVDPATVRQCTGIKDKNSIPIYEGDILKRETFGFPVIGVVVWNDKGFSGFMLRVESEDGYSFYSLGRGQYDGDEGDLCNDEIIGNIHDRTEESHGTTTGD